MRSIFRAHYDGNGVSEPYVLLEEYSKLDENNTPVANNRSPLTNSLRRRFIVKLRSVVRAFNLQHNCVGCKCVAGKCQLPVNLIINDENQHLDSFCVNVFQFSAYNPAVSPSEKAWNFTLDEINAVREVFVRGNKKKAKEKMKDLVRQCRLEEDLSVSDKDDEDIHEDEDEEDEDPYATE